MLELRPEVEALRARQNEASQGIAKAKKAGEDASAAIAEMQEVSRRVKALGEELSGVELELEGALGDMEAGARVAGSRFAYLKGDLVLLELALVRWTLELLGERGFEPVIPPVLVREEALFGTGFLPDTEQQIYRLADDALYLTGTSEVALASLHAGEMLAEGDLPLRYAGFSSCFRREAGAAGRDTRGILRVHQFDKVEMFSFVAPGQSEAELEWLTERAEILLQRLGLAYRVLLMSTREMGFTQARKYDLEVWSPGVERWLEVSSCSNFKDFQARRM